MLLWPNSSGVHNVVRTSANHIVDKLDNSVQHGILLQPALNDGKQIDINLHYPERFYACFSSTKRKNKEDPKISTIAKFGCEVVENIGLRGLQIL